MTMQWSPAANRRVSPFTANGGGQQAGIQFNGGISANSAGGTGGPAAVLSLILLGIVVLYVTTHKIQGSV